MNTATVEPASRPVTVAVDLPRPDALLAPAQRALTNAKAMTIDSSAMFSEAGSDLRAIKQRIDDLETLRKRLVKPFQDAVASANEVFRGPVETLKQAAEVLRTSMLGYQRAENEKAEKARRAAEEAAQAERDRLAAQAAATQARADAEAAELRRKAEAAAANGNVAQAARLESRAESREQAGASAAAAATMQAQAVIAAAVPALAPAPAAKGISTTKRWTARVTDKVALIQYVAQHPEFEAYLDINEAALRQFATATRGAAQIPGVAIEQAESLAVRRR